MKKKAILILLTGIFLAVAIGGTVAYYTKEFVSDQNIASAAVFDVDVVNPEGETIGDGQFDLGEDLFPGMEQKEVYQFQIDRNNTDLPVEYEVNLTPEGELFADGDSPIQMTLEMLEDDEWVEIDLASSFELENNSESFRVLVDWPHSDNDIDYQGLTGNVHLQVVATQVDDDTIYSGEINLLSLWHLDTHTTTGKEIIFYHDEDDYRIFEVLMEEDPNDPFTTEVGNLYVYEHEDIRGTWVGVYSEYEHFTTDPFTWRTELDMVDTSVDGVIRLEQPAGSYFSIESQELYDWFTGQ